MDATDEKSRTNSNRVESPLSDSTGLAGSHQASVINDADELLGQHRDRSRLFTLPTGQQIRCKRFSFGVEAQCAKLFPDNPFLACITKAFVDEHGDTLWATTDEQIAKFKEYDADIVEALIEIMKAYCLNDIDYDQAVKNSEAIRSASS